MEFFHQIFNSLNKTERWIFLNALLIFITSSVMWGILIFRTITVEIPVSSNIYREGVIGQPIAINPVLAGTNDIDRDLAELLFSGLIDLAKDYKMSENGQIWNITLKPGLHWSDGKPLTSDDVIFTIDTIQNSNYRSPLFFTWRGVIADRISELEIEFTLRTPYAFFLQNLENLKIIPKHIFGIIPSENFRLSNFNLEPIGSGPYKFNSLEKRNDGFITDYHFATNGYYAKEKPFIKNFDVKFYPNSQELISAFNRKEIDGFGGINPKNAENLEINYDILEKIIPQYYAIFINKNSKTVLANKNIISALNASIDKQKIINDVFGGKAIAVNQPILPIMEEFNPATTSIQEFSTDKAKKILDDERWLVNKETGFREKNIGGQTEILEFSIIVPEMPFLTETINEVKENWNAIGVKLNPIILSPNDVINEVIKNRNYQMVIFGNIMQNNPDIFAFWHSSERFYPGLNLSLYENKKVDALLESIRKNFNPESRKTDLYELQKIIIQDQPAIFLYSPTYLYVGPKDLGGFDEKIIITPSNRFKNINKWYLETTRIFK